MKNTKFMIIFPFIFPYNKYTESVQFLCHIGMIACIFLTNYLIHTVFHILSFLIHFNPYITFGFFIRKTYLRNDSYQFMHTFMKNLNSSWKGSSIFGFDTNTGFELSFNFIYFSSNWIHSDLSNGISEYEDFWRLR